MPPPRPPFAKALALKSLELALRFWPAQSRHWGQALAAELDEINRPAEALHWAFGGGVLFLRSHVMQALSRLRLPPGQTLTGVNTDSLQPRNPRFVTVRLFLAVVVLLVLPSSREATSIVFSSWRDFQPTDNDVRVVERLAAKAEKDHDARLLAFLANCEPHPERSQHFATRAVELDPTLLWVFASRFHRPEFSINRQWLERLRQSDPDNAFVHILAAESAAFPETMHPDRSSAHLEVRIGAVGPAYDKSRPTPAAHAEWSEHMEDAFRSPRYDSYAKRLRELTREGWQNAPQVPLSLVVYSFWLQFVPDLSQIERFADQKIAQAQQARLQAIARRPNRSFRKCYVRPTNG